MVRSKVKPTDQSILLLGRQKALLSDVLAERFRAHFDIQLGSEIAVGGTVVVGCRRRSLDFAARFAGCHHGAPPPARPNDSTVCADIGKSTQYGRAVRAAASCGLRKGAMLVSSPQLKLV